MQYPMDQAEAQLSFACCLCLLQEERSPLLYIAQFRVNSN